MTEAETKRLRALGQLSKRSALKVQIKVLTVSVDGYSTAINNNRFTVVTDTLAERGQSFRRQVLVLQSHGMTGKRILDFFQKHFAS